jgi:hypothetical protein
MDTMRVAPARAAALAAAGASGGFTAISAAGQEGTVSVTLVLGKRVRSCSRKSGMISTIASSSGAIHFDDNSPSARAAPMLPPPMITKVAVVMRTPYSVAAPTSLADADRTSSPIWPAPALD